MKRISHDIWPHCLLRKKSIQFSFSMSIPTPQDPHPTPMPKLNKTSHKIPLTRKKIVLTPLSSPASPKGNPWTGPPYSPLLNPSLWREALLHRDLSPNWEKPSYYPEMHKCRSQLPKEYRPKLVIYTDLLLMNLIKPVKQTALNQILISVILMITPHPFPLNPLKILL